VCRGLFEKDKELFAFLISTDIMKEEGLVTDVEWSLFLRGAGVINRDSGPVNPWPEKISPALWDIAVYAQVGVTAHDAAGVRWRCVMLTTAGP
jgi:hypothetical protein